MLVVKTTFFCYLPEDHQAKPLARFTVSNDDPDVFQLRDRIQSIIDKQALTHVRFGLEATGCYTLHLARYLQSVLDFTPNEREVYLFNPCLINQFKKAHYLDAPKNDRIDAWFIAAKVRSGHLPRPFTWSESLAALQRLTRARFHVMENLTQETNYLLTNLFLKFSSYSTGPFYHKTSATSLAVIEHFHSIEDIVQMSQEELLAFVIKKGKNRFEHPQDVVNSLQKVAHASY